MSGLWAVALILALFAAAWSWLAGEQRVDRRLSAISDAALVARADAQQAAIMRGDLIEGTFGTHRPSEPFLTEWRELHMPKALPTPKQPKARTHQPYFAIDTNGDLVTADNGCVTAPVDHKARPR